MVILEATTTVLSNTVNPVLVKVCEKVLIYCAAMSFLSHKVITFFMKKEMLLMNFLKVITSSLSLQSKSNTFLFGSNYI